MSTLHCGFNSNCPFVPADGTTVSAVHQENGPQSSGHSHVRGLPDQNHDGLHKLEHQNARL